MEQKHPHLYIRSMPFLAGQASWEVACGWFQAIINSSLSEEVFLAPSKESLVCPLLKKSLLDPIVLDNFSSLSHFSFLGKMAEKVVALQFQRTLEETYYMDLFRQLSDPDMRLKLHWSHSRMISGRMGCSKLDSVNAANSLEEIYRTHLHYTGYEMKFLIIMHLQNKTKH